MSKNTSIVIGSQFEEFIASRVATGRFASTSEAVRAGLRLLEEHEAKLDALRQAIDRGFAGSFRDFDINRIDKLIDSEDEADASRANFR